MPRTQEQFGEIRDRRRNQIMETALELFANEGYFTTSISRISQKANISKGLMYNYFASKEDLVIAIIDRGRQLLMESFDADHDGVLSPDEFQYHVEENFKLLNDYPDYWKLYFAILLQPAVYHLVQTRFADHMPRQRAAFENYFRNKGVADPVSEALLLDSLFDGICMNHVMNPESFPLEKMKEMILQRFK
jgi:AcrR family transcriptional regulator